MLVEVTSKRHTKFLSEWRTTHWLFSPEPKSDRFALPNHPGVRIESDAIPQIPVGDNELIPSVRSPGSLDPVQIRTGRLSFVGMSGETWEVRLQGSPGGTTRVSR